MFMNISPTLITIKISLKVVVSNLKPLPSRRPNTNASLPTKGIPKSINGNNWLNAPALFAVSDATILSTGGLFFLFASTQAS